MEIKALKILENYIIFIKMSYRNQVQTQWVSTVGAMVRNIAFKLTKYRCHLIITCECDVTFTLYCIGNRLYEISSINNTSMYIYVVWYTYAIRICNLLHQQHSHLNLLQLMLWQLLQGHALLSHEEVYVLSVKCNNWFNTSNIIYSYHCS